MDKLKEYLLRHIADLDVDPPPGDTWEHIGSKMSDGSYQAGFATASGFKARSGYPSWVVRSAAAACVIVLAGVGSWLVIKKSAPGNTAKPKEARHTVLRPKAPELTDEVANIDRSYSGLIDYQLRKLRATPLYAENSSYFSFYVKQLKQMDLDEQAVRNDIRTYGLTDEFLEQLINVYQQKLSLLKSLQTEVNKVNNKVRERQAPSGKPEVHYLNI